jgi:hypothetical protein
MRRSKSCSATRAGERKLGSQTMHRTEDFLFIFKCSYIYIILLNTKIVPTPTPVPARTSRLLNVISLQTFHCPITRFYHCTSVPARSSHHDIELLNTRFNHCTPVLQKCPLSSKCNIPFFQIAVSYNLCNSRNRCIMLVQPTRTFLRSAGWLDACKCKLSTYFLIYCSKNISHLLCSKNISHLLIQLNITLTY